MKTQYRRIFLALTVLASMLMWQSCKKDESTLDLDKIPAVSVDTAGMSAISIFQFETLVIDPKVQANGLSESDLEYEWLINTETDNRDFVTISQSKKLEYEVALKPTAAGTQHILTLKITDKRNQLEYYTTWPMTVRNSIGDGLVIVETYDGSTTDISHLMSPLVTNNYNQENLRMKVFSSVNGFTIPGLVRQLRFTNIQGTGNALLGSTENSIFAIKTLDYTLDKENEDLFFVPQDKYGAGFLGGINQNDMMVIDGKLSSVWLQIGRYGLSFPSDYRIPDILAVNARYDYPNIITSFYSEEVGGFLYQASLSAVGDRTIRRIPNSTSSLFNPASVPNKANVTAGVNTQSDFMHLLKDKTTSQYSLYLLDKGDWFYDWDTNIGTTVPSEPKGLVHFNGAPEIAQAEHFLLLDDQQVMLYATKTKIYAAIYSASTPRYELRYTVPAGEEITSLSVYQQASYPKNDPLSYAYHPRNNKQLVMGTYTGAEGKLSLLPLINQGEAVIDAGNIKTYGGFGRILMTTSQL